LCDNFCLWNRDWFQDVPIRQILNIQELFPNHFYWPDLDVDLSKEIIKNPDRFPLKAKS
jgi:predicted acetyltransferase